MKGGRRERKIDVGREYKRQTSSRLVRECFNLEGTRTEEKSIFFLMEERRDSKGAESLCNFPRPNFSFFRFFLFRLVSAQSYVHGNRDRFFVRVFFSFLLLWCDLGYWHIL